MRVRKHNLSIFSMFFSIFLIYSAAYGKGISTDADQNIKWALSNNLLSDTVEKKPIIATVSKSGSGRNSESIIDGSLSTSWRLNRSDAQTKKAWVKLNLSGAVKLKKVVHLDPGKMQYGVKHDELDVVIRLGDQSFSYIKKRGSLASVDLNGTETATILIAVERIIAKGIKSVQFGELIILSENNGPIFFQETPSQESLVNLGDYLYSNQLLKEATTIWAFSSKQYPDASINCVKTGFGLMQLECFELSRKFFRQALKIAPNDALTTLNLVDLELKEGNFTAASSLLETLDRQGYPSRYKNSYNNIATQVRVKGAKLFGIFPFGNDISKRRDLGLIVFFGLSAVFIIFKVHTVWTYSSPWIKLLAAVVFLMAICNLALSAYYPFSPSITELLASFSLLNYWGIFSLAAVILSFSYLVFYSRKRILSVKEETLQEIKEKKNIVSSFEKVNSKNYREIIEFVDNIDKQLKGIR